MHALNGESSSVCDMIAGGSPCRRILQVIDRQLTIPLINTVSWCPEFICTRLQVYSTSYVTVMPVLKNLAFTHLFRNPRVLGQDVVLQYVAWNNIFSILMQWIHFYTAVLTYLNWLYQFSDFLSSEPFVHKWTEDKHWQSTTQVHSISAIGRLARGCCIWPLAGEDDSEQ